MKKCVTYYLFLFKFNMERSKKILEEALIEAKKNCSIKFGNGIDEINNRNNSNGTLCSAFWDGILCWPGTKAGETSIQPCPSYFYGFDKLKNASRQCLPNGEWYVYVETNDSWTNYTQCSEGPTATVIDTVSSINTTYIATYIPIIKNIARTGYFVSLNSLIVAFCIMFFIRKLHCARNKLHMHLFASFIFRAAMFFIKDILFVGGVGLSSDLTFQNGSQYFVQKAFSNNWECKMVITLWNYFTLANYSWILMEGLYLYNLILLALFSDSSSSIRYYIILGWGLPAIDIAIYIGVRIFTDDNLCWTTFENRIGFLIIRIPTMISNIVNLLLFIKIARVLLLKLRSPINEETKVFRRWARSTLVLVPLFGVHYTLFMGMSYSIGVNETVELIWLFCDQLFASFQGFFVAVLYCFLNGEVKTELRSHLKHFPMWVETLFNCGNLFRTPRSRPSVCTTLSCSSLYNSTITQKCQNRRSKWDITQSQGMKPRHSSIPEKSCESCPNCQINEKDCSEHSTNWNNKYLHEYDSAATLKCGENNCYCSNGNNKITEITACLGKCDHNYSKPDQLELEMITLDTSK